MRCAIRKWNVARANISIITENKIIKLVKIIIQFSWSLHITAIVIIFETVNQHLNLNLFELQKLPLVIMREQCTHSDTMIYQTRLFRIAYNTILFCTALIFIYFLENTHTLPYTWWHCQNTLSQVWMKLIYCKSVIKQYICSYSYEHMQAHSQIDTWQLDKIFG